MSVERVAIAKVWILCCILGLVVGALVGAGLSRVRDGVLIGYSVGFGNALAVSLMMQTKPVRFHANRHRQ